MPKGCSNRTGAGKAATKKSTKAVNEGKKGCPCPKTMEDKVKACDGGIYAEAKKANGGKDVKIVSGSPVGGFGGHADTAKGEVVIGPNPDTCSRAQTLLFELNNIANGPNYNKIEKKAVAGDLNREQYIRANEEIEYNGLMKVMKAYDSCKKKWCCEKSPCRYEWMRSAKNFNNYYNNFLATSHKEYYGKVWDKDYKAIYEKKHPAKK